MADFLSNSDSVISESVNGRYYNVSEVSSSSSSSSSIVQQSASHSRDTLGTCLMEGNGVHTELVQLKPKTHECSICGLEFAIGQALGGHMRRHRPTTPGDREVPAVLKRSNSRRVVCLDLNLTPMENDLEFNGF
ncbi:hypothetical protein GIB67_037542 [Kingdonia uniflora]|uniref:C2H2-type domain-containing protein n=1 Tax=Kingdonia uniflora TaxID=39325 RepID=A0A7J7LGQ4_9MAGN|nr:hypothetical protein GIB67_036194 [Kingdonia uniflora]KAF6164385.1 hypothetical protein GIB67_037542 [Kingdonia uniflora]